MVLKHMLELLGLCRQHLTLSLARQLFRQQIFDFVFAEGKKW
jgi:hypothetical protein